MADSDKREIDGNTEHQQDVYITTSVYSANAVTIHSDLLAPQAELRAANVTVDSSLAEDNQNVLEASMMISDQLQNLSSSSAIDQPLASVSQQNIPCSSSNLHGQSINVKSDGCPDTVQPTQIHTTALDKSATLAQPTATASNPEGTEVKLTTESIPLTQGLEFEGDVSNQSPYICHSRVEENVSKVISNEQVSTTVLNIVPEPGLKEQITLTSEGSRSAAVIEEFCQEPEEMLVTEENIVWIGNDNRYNLSTQSVPSFVKGCSSEFHKNTDDNFLKGCKWSPDGSCVVTNSNDNCLRIFNPSLQNSNMEPDNEMAPCMRIKESGAIYDFAWHPKMSTVQPDFCRVVCTCSGIPIHLWDSNSGKIVSNYRAYDQYDEITAAYSLAFSPDGSKIYAGYNKAIRIFDTEYPVRSCKTIKTFNSQKRDGQPGIISCFAHSPNGSGLYIAGSYSRHIGMYDSVCDKLVCLMQGQHGGVTHVMLSPDGTKLYSGGRKDAEILCWDIRNMGKIMFSVLRDVKTNQRIYFDLSGSGRYLLSGNNDGTIAFWDTIGPADDINGEMFLKPCSQFQAHQDCVNGVSFNHHHDMIASSSGQRHFQSFEDYDSDDSCEDDDMEVAETRDFSLKLWKIPLIT